MNHARDAYDDYLVVVSNNVLSHTHSLSPSLSLSLFEISVEERFLQACNCDNNLFTEENGLLLAIIYSLLYRDCCVLFILLLITASPLSRRRERNSTPRFTRGIIMQRDNQRGIAGPVARARGQITYTIRHGS